MVPVVTTGPQYGGSALPRRHGPPRRRYGQYRDCLRLEFKFTCVYCLSTEREAAPGEAYGGFEIEHFKPKGRAEFRSIRHDYVNLLWSCHACNRAKGHRWPSKKERALGMRFVDPSKEALGRFLRIRGVRVQAENGEPAGDYMIEEIRLNSPVHIDRRRKRGELEKRFAVLEATSQVLRARLGSAPGDTAIRSNLDALDHELAALRGSLDRHAPLSDTPTACLCSPGAAPSGPVSSPAAP